MKVDDDSYINLRRLSEYVTIIDKRCSQKCIVGHVLGPNSPVIRPKFVQGEVHEEFVGKWVVPSYIYSQETFPNAVSGSGYIISQDMISCIFKSGTLLLTSYSRVWNKLTPLNKRSPLENFAKRIIVAPFFTLYYEVQNKAVAPGIKSKN